MRTSVVIFAFNTTVIYYAIIDEGIYKYMNTYKFVKKIIMVLNSVVKIYRTAKSEARTVTRFLVIYKFIVRELIRRFIIENR